MSKREESRNRILVAAIELAESEGLLNLTIDKVAEQAGLSKGGVIHHFSSKDKLLKGVIQLFSNKLEEQLTRTVADDPVRKFRWIRAMMAIGIEKEESNADTPPDTTHENSEELNIRFDRLMLSILTVAIHNPELIEPIQEIGQRLRGRLTADPEDGLEQLLYWLIMDGLFLWMFVGLVQPDDPLIQQVRQEILNRISSETDS